MSFKDWRTYFTNLFYTLEFPPHIRGVRFMAEWNSSNAGGFPVGKNKDGWAKNPQFGVEVKKEIDDVYIYLSQTDRKDLTFLNNA
jgi:Calpain large subunit, domain III